MLLRNNRVIESPIRLVMAANTVNNNINELDNIEMAMTTASPQVEKTVGPSSELNTEQGQVMENIAYREEGVQIIDPEIHDSEKTDSIDKSVGPGEREKEIEVEKESDVESQNPGRTGQDPLQLIMKMIAGLEQNIDQKLETKLNNLDSRFNNTEQRVSQVVEEKMKERENQLKIELNNTERKLSQVVEDKLNERDRNMIRENERNKMELIGRIADQIEYKVQHTINKNL